MTSFKNKKTIYSLRILRSLVSKRKFSTTYGIDTINYRRPQIWQDLPQDIKNSDSFNIFKSNTKRYEIFTCHCKSCKSFITCVGYND